MYKKVPFVLPVYIALKVVISCIKQHYHIFDKLVIVPIDGGVGSQIGQYLFGCAVARSSGLQVKYDLSWYEHCGWDLHEKNKREFSLFKIFPSLSRTMQIASKDDILIYQTFFSFSLKDMYEYNPDVLFSKSRRYLGGYYVNRRYNETVKKDIESLLVFDVALYKKNIQYLEQIKQAKCSIAIHVRRGDFVDSIHDITNKDYFLRAAEQMRQSITNPTFFVFSNDIAWAKEAFAAFDDFMYVESNDNDNGHIDLYLMSQCMNFVISNSSFSCCAAMLSPHTKKIVMCPYVFYKPQDTETFKDMQKTMDLLIDPSWIRIKFSH